MIAINEEIDLALKGLRGAFERRAALIAGLARTEVVDPSFVARFSTKAAATRVFAYHGLHKFAALETPAPQAHLPLADTSSVLVGIGAPPAKPAPRATTR